MWLELVQGILRRRLTRSAKWRGTLTGVGAHSDPGAQSQNILPELVAELRELLSDPDRNSEAPPDPVGEMARHPDGRGRAQRSGRAIAKHSSRTCRGIARAVIRSRSE